MTVAFGEAYANQYDRLYREKNYSSECDLIEQVFDLYGEGQIKKVLDLGCGTGNHSLPLAARGYEVTGVDLSPDMLRVARQKAKSAELSLNLVQGDIRDAKIGEVFDAALIMFAVLGYLLSNEDSMAALQNARAAIRTGGLLVFDVWYGPAVLTIRPTDRARLVSTEHGQVIRLVSSQLDTRRHVCSVKYDLWHIEGDRVKDHSEELHATRFFFPMELEMMLTQANFSLVSLTAFPGLDSPADETSWNALGVARAS